MTIKTIDEFARSEGFSTLRARQNSDGIRFAVNSSAWVDEPLKVREIDCRQVLEKGELVVPGPAQVQSGRPVKIMGVDDLAFTVFSVRDNARNESLLSSANQVIDSIANGSYQFSREVLSCGNDYR